MYYIHLSYKGINWHEKKTAEYFLYLEKFKLNLVTGTFWKVFINFFFSLKLKKTIAQKKSGAKNPCAELQPVLLNFIFYAASAVAGTVTLFDDWCGCKCG